MSDSNGTSYPCHLAEAKKENGASSRRCKCTDCEIMVSLHICETVKPLLPTTGPAILHLYRADHTSSALKALNALQLTLTSALHDPHILTYGTNPTPISPPTIYPAPT